MKSRAEQFQETVTALLSVLRTTYEERHSPRSAFARPEFLPVYRRELQRVVADCMGWLNALPPPEGRAIVPIAQVAYEAYGAIVDWKNVRGKPMPAWASLPAKIQAAWKHAADAVLARLEPSCRADDRAQGETPAPGPKFTRW